MQISSYVDLADVDLGRHARRLRLDTLVRLRWLAIAGQSAAVLSTWFILGFDLPIALCFLVIAASAGLNLYLRLRFPLSQRLRDRAAWTWHRSRVSCSERADHLVWQTW